jgi:cytoskeletal protein CcmA (bactofilin family)
MEESMFSQSADQPAPDQPQAPVGMRELPPQPAKPAMPAYTLPTAAPAEREAGSSDDSVVAKDDHVEGTFTSRGTVRIFGSVKGRIEAVQLCIEDGAHVDAEVIVDEAIVAGEFTGTLTCRDRLEARPSGRISGRVETYKLMLHEGASVEGEMHMLTDSAVGASETIRGNAPIRGETTSQATASTSPRATTVPPTTRTDPGGATSTGTVPRDDAMATATARAVVAQLAARPDAGVDLRPTMPAVRITPRATSAVGTTTNTRNGNGTSSGF